MATRKDTVRMMSGVVIPVAEIIPDTELEQQEYARHP